MKILIGIDKTEESQIALKYACQLMEHFEAEVDAVYVQPNVTEMLADGSHALFVSKNDLAQAIDQETGQVEENVLESCEICISGQVPCQPMIVEGDPADELLHMAEAGHYDMIVLGAHGRSSFGGFLLGAVHAKVLHHARLPVLLVRNVRPIQRLLVAYRGSQCDQGALEFIAPLFAKKKPEITIMHVQETGLAESEEFAQACVLTGEQTLRDFGYQPVKKMAKGDFVEEILKDVAIERYDLLVLGAYGHKKPRYLKVISDEALNLVRLTTRPVLVYRESKDV
jgi:nucleotide-binding universal stress UspA family protein